MTCMSDGLIQAAYSGQIQDNTVFIGSGNPILFTPVAGKSHTGFFNTCIFIYDVV